MMSISALFSTLSLNVCWITVQSVMSVGQKWGEWISSCIWAHVHLELSVIFNICVSFFYVAYEENYALL